jgi:hypothetical protein
VKIFKTYNSKKKYGLASFFNTSKTEDIQKEDIIYEFNQLKSDHHLPNKLLKTIDEDLNIDFNL